MDSDIAQYIPKQNILMKVDRSTKRPVYTIDVHTSNKYQKMVFIKIYFDVIIKRIYKLFNPD